MKNSNIINTAVGVAILFGTVWLISRAWKKGQETKSGFIGVKRNSSRLLKAKSAQNCEQLASQYFDGCVASTIEYSCDKDRNGNLFVKKFDCELQEGGVRRIRGGSLQQVKS
jgi:hypothetical protein